MLIIRKNYAANIILSEILNSESHDIFAGTVLGRLQSVGKIISETVSPDHQNCAAVQFPVSRQGHNVGRKCAPHPPPAPVPSGTECRCFSAYSVPAERYIRGRICRDGACT
ncbi:MAG: hypothetical protein LBS55_11710, partial [Prevotellaceae bacterium]|nr:hypothetical protein [Prevotellaceae bacterium]